MKWNSIMAHNFTSNRDLWVNISTRHISYLCEDKSLEKLKHQNLLQNYIKEFIFSVPHRHKFSFAKTAEVLQQSVCSVKFNGLKAAAAWSSLSIYANNLYSQPWRKEYHEIKLYSGFYKHQIENCLSGVEAIFELMGYNRVSGDKMVVDGPINVNQLAATSLDALIAMCECQVLFTIFKEISKHIPAITWADILRVRELYTGTPDQMINVIISLYAYPADCCTDCHFNYPRYQAAPECRKCTPAQSALTCVPLNGYRAPTYHPSVTSVRYQHSASIATDHLPFANGHYHHQVPTAKLIDYEDMLDGYPTSSSTLAGSRRHVPSSVERWNWTNDCQPLSYRHHHAAEGRYVPSSCSSESISYEEDSVRTRSTKLSQERSSGAGGTTTIAGTAGSCSSHGGSSRKRDQSSSSESSHRARLATDDDAPPLSSNAATANTSAATSASVAVTSGEPEPVAKTKSAGTSETFSTPTWECWNCTFYNSLQNNVCEMCGKSKNASEEASLVSGGKQCKYCTLVNKREATKCEACDNSLENSPTYV